MDGSTGGSAASLDKAKSVAPRRRPGLAQRMQPPEEDPSPVMEVLEEVQALRSLESVSEFRWTDLEAKLKCLEVEFQVLYSERKRMKETIDLQERYRNVVSSAKSSLSLNEDHWKDAQMRAQKQMTEHLTCELTQEKIRAQELEAMLLHGDSSELQNQVSILEEAVGVAEERASDAEARAGAAESDYELVAQELAGTRKTVAKLEGE